MDSFQAKIGWNSLRKGENKNYRSVPFRSNPTRNRIAKKQQKNSKKIKNYHYGYISSHNRLEKNEKQRKQKLSFRFVVTRRVKENSKKIGKNFKKLKNTTMASFQAIIGWRRMRKRKNKNYRPVSFRPNA